MNFRMVQVVRALRADHDVHGWQFQITDRQAVLTRLSMAWFNDQQRIPIQHFRLFQSIRGESKMFQPKPLLATIFSSAGLLLGGLAGLFGGSYFGRESTVIVCYIVGALIGAGTGILLSRHLISRASAEANGLN